MRELTKVKTGGGTDCLNTIRLLAALQVLYGHTLEHLQIDLPSWIGFVLSFFHGVPIFFTMSGYLIWLSIGRSNTFSVYCKKRFWRIYPELWVAVLVEAIVLLLLYHQPINIPQFGAFLFGQATIFQFWTPDCLRGYGCGCPNGSLWTICVLIQFYLVAYYTFKQLHNRSIRRWLGVLAALIVVSIASHWLSTRFNQSIAFKLYRETFIPYYWMFLFGAFVAEFKDKILPTIVRYWYVFALLNFAMLFIKTDIPTYHYGCIVTTVSFFACLGIGYMFPKLNIKTDISYAVYIYHMTIVNALLTLGFSRNPIWLIVTVVSTILVSYLSTVTIGRFSMKMKYRHCSI